MTKPMLSRKAFATNSLKQNFVWDGWFGCDVHHKGQVISKGFFGVFNFFQKTNENTSHSSKNEFIRSFFGRIHGLTICFRN